MDEKGKSKPKTQKDLLARAVIFEKAGKRRTSVKMKTRSEVSGGGVKPWRQKGTGRARQGSTRAVQWVGGGQAFGSSRSNFREKMNRKARQKALATLLYEIKENGRLVVEALEFEKPSTRGFVDFLEEKNLDGKVLLLYGEGRGKNALLSARNVARVKCLNTSCINVGDLLGADWLLVSTGDAAAVEVRIASVGE